MKSKIEKMIEINLGKYEPDIFVNPMNGRVESKKKESGKRK